MSDVSPIMVNGVFVSAADRKNAGIAPWDGHASAALKLEAYWASQRPPTPSFTYTSSPLPPPIYSSGPVDLRSQYEKDLDSAKRQNMARFAIILVIVGVLFWVLNATLGANIRGNSFYGTSDSIRFYAMELMAVDYYNSDIGGDYLKKSQKQAAQSFSKTYGSLFKADTPFEKMFDDCKGKFSCSKTSIGAVQKLQRFAKKPGTLLDDMCTIQSGQLIQGTISDYSGLLDSKFAAQDQYDSNVCISVNPAQVKAVAEPLNKRYKLAEAGVLILIPLAVFLLLLFIVPKAEYPKKER